MGLTSGGDTVNLRGFFWLQGEADSTVRIAVGYGTRFTALVNDVTSELAGAGYNTVIDQFALSIDLAPTLIELANCKATSRMDGRSLVPLLAGESPKNWRTSFLVEYNTDTVFPRVRNMGYRAIRTKRWKYIRYNELDGTSSAKPKRERR